MNTLPQGSMLQIFTKYTQAPIVSDEELNAWADFYQREPALKNRHWFDIFIGDPVRFCREIGMLPRPHDGAVPGEQAYRYLLPSQRYVAGRIE